MTQICSKSSWGCKVAALNEMHETCFPLVVCVVDPGQTSQLSSQGETFSWWTQIVCMWAVYISSDPFPLGSHRAAGHVLHWLWLDVRSRAVYSTAAASDRAAACDRLPSAISTRVNNSTSAQRNTLSSCRKHFHELFQFSICKRSWQQHFGVYVFLSRLTTCD